MSKNEQNSAETMKMTTIGLELPRLHIVYFFDYVPIMQVYPLKIYQFNLTMIVPQVEKENILEKLTSELNLFPHYDLIKM